MRPPSYRLRAAVAVALTVLLAAAVASVAPAGIAQAAETCDNQSLRADKGNLKKVRSAVRCLVNRERTSRGLDALKVSKRLRKAAHRHSRDMVERRYFAHVSPGGSDLVARARRTGYIASRSVWRLAENLGWGSGVLGTPKAMVKAWMESPGHRENILRAEMEHIGVGLALGTPRGGSGLTGTLLFGARR